MTLEPLWIVRSLTLGGLVAVAAVVGVVVRLQLRGMGMRDPDDGIRWARVISGLSAWLVLLGGLGLATRLDGELGLVSHYTFEAFVVLLPFLPASIVLAAASAFARDRRAEAERTGDETAAAEARWAMVGAGVVSALVAAQAEAFWTLLLIGAVGGAGWLLVNDGARGRAADAWVQLQAGSRLRGVLRPDVVLHRDGREVLVVGPVGLLATDVLIGGEAQLLPNRELLLLASAQLPASG